MLCNLVFYSLLNNKGINKDLLSNIQTTPGKQDNENKNDNKEVKESNENLESKDDSIKEIKEEVSEKKIENLSENDQILDQALNLNSELENKVSINKPINGDKVGTMGSTTSTSNSISVINDSKGLVKIDTNLNEDSLLESLLNVFILFIP